MALQLNIAITKEIIMRCKNCGNEKGEKDIAKNCAVAVALHNIFPDAYVTNHYVFPFGIASDQNQGLKIQLPVIAQQFIKLFDGFYMAPKLRLILPEFEFVIDVPDDVIEQINIDEVRELIAGKNHIQIPVIKNHLAV